MTVLRTVFDLLCTGVFTYLAASVPFVWRRITLTNVSRRARAEALERRSPSDYVAHDERIQQLDDAPLFRWTP